MTEVTKRQPSELDRLIGHILVGIGVAYVGSRLLGRTGGLVAGVLGVVAHNELDSPIAQLVAGVIDI